MEVRSLDVCSGEALLVLWPRLTFVAPVCVRRCCLEQMATKRELRGARDALRDTLHRKGELRQLN